MHRDSNADDYAARICMAGAMLQHYDADGIAQSLKGPKGAVLLTVTVEGSCLCVAVQHLQECRC